MAMGAHLLRESLRLHPKRVGGTICDSMGICGAPCGERPLLVLLLVGHVELAQTVNVASDWDSLVACRRSCVLELALLVGVLRGWEGIQSGQPGRI